jgi:hypothetical protein
MELITGEARCSGVDLDNSVMMVPSLPWRVAHPGQSRAARKPIAVLFMVSLVRGEERAQALERCHAHCCRGLAHFAVRSQRGDLVVAPEPEVAHEPRLFCRFIVIVVGAPPSKEWTIFVA